MSIFGKSKQRSQPVSNPNQGEVRQAVTKYTLVSEGTTFSGEINSNDPLVVNGKVEGKVNVKNSMAIGKTGFVRADVKSATLEVNGKIVGDIVATSGVSIKSTGSVEGNIRSPKLMISEGALFRGNIDMSHDSEKEVKRPEEGKPVLAAGKPAGESEGKRFELRKDSSIHSAVSSDV